MNQVRFIQKSAQNISFFNIFWVFQIRQSLSKAMYFEKRFLFSRYMKIKVPTYFQSSITVFCLFVCFEQKTNITYRRSYKSLTVVYWRQHLKTIFFFLKFYQNCQIFNQKEMNFLILIIISWISNVRSLKLPNNSACVLDKQSILNRIWLEWLRTIALIGALTRVVQPQII